MTDQTVTSARERIEAALGDAYAVGYLDGRDGHMDRLDYAEATDRIIAIIRTALLSEPAVDAAMAVIEYRSQEPQAAQDWKEERDDWKEGVSAAWDSVMGETDVRL